MAPLPKTMPALDGLRGVAILMVILTHVGGGWQAAMSLTRDTIDWPSTFVLPQRLDLITSEAYHGVTLFFVVSAFTLTLSLARGGGGLGAYAIRRVARVGPGYWLAGVAYIVLGGLAARDGAPNGISPSDLGLAAVFGSAWQGGASMAVVPGGWSVSCEVAFYVALPLLLWIVRGRPWLAALLAVAAAAGVQIVARALIARDAWHYTPEYIYPLSQAPVFLFGITAALVVQRYRLPGVRAVTMVFLAFAICGVPFSPVGAWHVLPHLQFAALAATVVAFAAVDPPRLLASAAMRRIGEVSYSMYLVHFVLLAPGLWLAERCVPADDWATLAVHMGLTSAASFALAVPLHRWVEQPGIRLGRSIIARSGLGRARDAALAAGADRAGAAQPGLPMFQ